MSEVAKKVPMVSYQSVSRGFLVYKKLTHQCCNCGKRSEYALVLRVPTKYNVRCVYCDHNCFFSYVALNDHGLFLAAFTVEPYGIENICAAYWKGVK